MKSEIDWLLEKMLALFNKVDDQLTELKKIEEKGSNSPATRKEWVKTKFDL